MAINSMILKDGSNATDENSSNKSTESAEPNKITEVIETNEATESNEVIETVIETNEATESNESTEKTNYVGPKKGHDEAQNTKKPTQKPTEKSFWKDHPKTGIFVGWFSKKMSINDVMLKDCSNTNSSNETTGINNYSKANVSPKKSNIEAQITDEPTQKSFWKDHPKIGIFVGLCAIFSLVGLCVATYFVTQNTPHNWNCNESACKVGTGIVSGVKGAVAGISYVMCKYKFGLSCGVYPVTSLMSATLAAGIQLCSLCEEPPFGNHGTGELNEKMKNTSEKPQAKPNGGGSPAFFSVSGGNNTNNFSGSMTMNGTAETNNYTNSTITNNEIDNKDGFIGLLGEKDYKKVDMKHNGTSVTLS